jgi:hypothetical protein
MEQAQTPVVEAPETSAPAPASAATKLLTKAAKTKAKTEVAAEDFIVKTAHQVENLTKDSAYSLIPQLIEDIEGNHFRLGGVLAVIQSNGWNEGFGSFKEAVEEKFGLHYRKAMYLIAIYNALVKNQIPWVKIKDLGWTKLKELAPILTPENVDEWVTKASVLTVKQLIEAIKKSSTATEGETTSDGQPTSTVETMTFKLHMDQKETVKHALDKAKAEVGTDVDTVALENICVGYLGGAVAIGKSAEAPTLKEMMAKHTYEEVLMVFEQVFPDVNLQVTV